MTAFAFAFPPLLGRALTSVNGPGLGMSLCIHVGSKRWQSVETVESFSFVLALIFSLLFHSYPHAFQRQIANDRALWISARIVFYDLGVPLTPGWNPPRFANGRDLLSFVVSRLAVGEW
jgi:hypothetical protein